jgi:hypothetical protein
MMDNSNPFAPAVSTDGEDPVVTPAKPGPAVEPPAAPSAQAASPGLSPASAELSPAFEKFKSCRWRADPDMGEFCTHRDVLPFAGKTAFNADSWCPECAFYKLRRTPKKRERADYSY